MNKYKQNKNIKMLYGRIPKDRYYVICESEKNWGRQTYITRVVHPFTEKEIWMYGYYYLNTLEEMLNYLWEKWVKQYKDYLEYQKYEHLREKTLKEIEHIIEKEIDGRVSYSAYDYDENDIPINNLNDIVVKGKCQFTYQGWGERTYKSPILYNPTYLKLTKIANEAIYYTNDFHHIFFEGIEKIDNGLYELVMGS